MFKIVLIAVAGLVLPYNLLLGFGYTSEGAICGTLTIIAIMFILYMANQYGAFSALVGAGSSDEEEIDDGQRLL